MSLAAQIREWRRQHGTLWFHGSPTQEPLEDMGALWLADTWGDALYYAEGKGTLHVFTLRRHLPSLCNRPTWAALTAAAGLCGRTLRPCYVRGLLDPDDHQRPLLAAAQQAGFTGLLMKDRTVVTHQSAALWSRDRLDHIGHGQARGRRRLGLLPETETMHPPHSLPAAPHLLFHHSPNHAGA